MRHRSIFINGLRDMSLGGRNVKFDCLFLFPYFDFHYSYSFLYIVLLIPKETFRNKVHPCIHPSIHPSRRTITYHLIQKENYYISTEHHMWKMVGVWDLMLAQGSLFLLMKLCYKISITESKNKRKRESVYV